MICAYPPCSHEFEPHSSEQLYCSKRCRQDANVAARREGRRKSPQEKKCLWCFATFQQRRTNQRYCCSRHAQLASCRRKHAEYLATRKGRKCPMCDREFMPKGSQVYCSTECARTARNTPQRTAYQENYHRWRRSTMTYMPYIGAAPVFSCPEFVEHPAPGAE